MINKPRLPRSSASGGNGAAGGGANGGGARQLFSELGPLQSDVSQNDLDTKLVDERARKHLLNLIRGWERPMKALHTEIRQLGKTLDQVSLAI